MSLIQCPISYWRYRYGYIGNKNTKYSVKGLSKVSTFNTYFSILVLKDEEIKNITESCRM